MKRALIGLVLMLSLASFANEVPVIMQSGVDATVIEEREIETGTTIKTVAAPSVDGYIFIGWSSTDTSAFKSRDRLGRALEVARQTIYGETLLTANYLAEDVDSDKDGIADGYELYWYGDLDETVMSDTDDDGYDFAAELKMGLDPLMADRAATASIVWGDGRKVQYNPNGWPRYTIRSEPEGCLFETVDGCAEPGTILATSSYGSDTTFAYWMTNGVRVADRHGRAKDRISFPMGNDAVEIVAVCEDDADLRQQLYWYGRAVDPASVTDGDGYTFAQEIAAGLDPLMADRGATGPIVWADGVKVQYNPLGYQQYIIRSEPEGLLFKSVTNIVKSGTSVTTATLFTDSGFAYWTLNGVRVADRRGRAKDKVTFTMADAPVEAVAVCEANDSLREQLYWYGRAIDPASDTDGDGFTFAQEIAAGLDPLLADKSPIGGIMKDDGAEVTVNFQLYDQLQGAIVNGTYEELFFSPYAQNADTSSTFANGTQIWPVVADVNGDGLWDLIVCSATTTNIFVNVGTKGNPQFAKCGSVGADAPGGPSVDLEMNSTAKLAGMTLDVAPVGALSATTNAATLLVSDEDGRIWLYVDANVSFASNAKGETSSDAFETNASTWELQHKVWGGSFVGFANGLMLAAVDWEDDGDLDCLCGTADGKLMLLRDPKVGRPANLKADAGVDSVKLSWDPNEQSRVRGYKVYRADDYSAEDDAAARWGQRALPGLPSYRDTGLSTGTYGYKVSALSRFYTAGNSTPTETESLASEIVSATVGGPLITVGEPVNSTNGTVEIVISINNSLNYNAAGTAIEVSYDAADLAYFATRPSGLSEKLNWKATLVNEGDSLQQKERIVRISISSGEVAPGAGTFFTLVFRGLSSGVLMGDLNGDGQLTVDDLRLLAKLKSAAGRRYSDYQLKAGDFNHNNKLDNADYQALRELLKERGSL